MVFVGGFPWGVSVGAVGGWGGGVAISLGNSIAVAYLISIELPLSAAYTNSHTHPAHACRAMQRLFDSWFDYIFKVIDIWHIV